ncbi:GNAT family N-acetyltransferase [Paenibacillus sp. CF384]|uniref:GNAT family N-acetyltransferase n=1 Tax=Paenibacillus sp. CF384 TaxID=1884382 RepID=UPI00089C78FC|nr:GNAT family N-acetyltransferase [Paenibacillus sp. CF384]SDW54350.1 Acetyltransferase (GNAT) family protein [Paenibacillus sp. CF384]
MLTIRFGNRGDLEAAVGWDRHTPEHILSWKLDHKDIIMADQLDGCVGYMKLEHLWSQFPYIGLIRVKEELRGNGIGMQMLQFAQAHLKQQGAAKLYSSSQADEPAPQMWHRKMGFTECGILSGINDGGVGELFFVKEL